MISHRFKAKNSICVAPMPVEKISLFPQDEIMFIKVTKKSNGKTSVRIMESTRIGEKTEQKTLMSLGCVREDYAIEALKKTDQGLLIKMRNDKKPALPGMKEIVYGKEPDKKPSLKKRRKSSPINEIDLSYAREKERVIHGIGGVCGAIYDRLKFNTIIQDTYKDTEWNDILKSCVLSRIADPQSKRKTVDTLELDYNQCIPVEKMYRMMDRLYKNIDKVKTRVSENTLSLFKQEVDVLFFDVTTLYFESFIPDDLRNYGFSKDCKF